MHIALVTNNYKPYSGGVVSSVDSFAQELRKNGHKVTIITLNFLGAQHADDEHVIRLKCPIKFMYHQNHMAVPWFPDRQIQELFDTLRPDIIHSQHPFLLGTSAKRYAKKYGIPIVFTYHTRYADYLHYIPLPDSIVRPVVQRFVDGYCSSVDSIIAPTRSIEALIRSRNVDTPIHVIPSGLQPAFVPQERPVKKTGQGTPFNLLVVSRFAPEKNISVLIDLFKRLGDRFTMTLIGYGPEFEPLKNYGYRDLGLSPERITFIHKPEKQIIADAYKKADLFLFSSITDVQPLVFVESMAGSTPIIALAGPGRDNIINGVNGFVVNTIDEMETMVRQIADNPDLHAALQDGAWRMAQDYWPSQTTKKLLGVYEGLVTNTIG